MVLDAERASVTDSAGRFDVHGVEPGRHRVRVDYAGFASQVYTGPAQIPPQFRAGTSGCVRAAIVIWTRTGAD
ncbi:MAG: carboxypeptidase-like regulatory domain-containing protein [Gemmatimonadota bacterium]